MKRTKMLFVMYTVATLALPSFLVTAAENTSQSAEGKNLEEAVISSKDEVVYAKLNATGKQQEIYTVNILDIEQAGRVIDYGTYSSLKNLTDLSEITQKGDTVEFTAPKGKFYYQGNMTEEPLPWDINISYWLDGKETDPSELAGKDGHIQIRLALSENEEVNPIFFDNYLVQVSLTLNQDVYSNILADGGMIANAGKNKQVNFTVMPGKEKELVLEADVVDFELQGIDISAVPSAMPIEAPNVDEMTGDMESLSDAIKAVNNGVGELKSGVSELNNGVFSLRDGSEQFKNGISQFNGASTELVNGSQSIDQALESISLFLQENTGEMGLGDLGQLVEGLTQISDGLGQTAAGLAILKENYANANGALAQAMEAIPAANLTEEELQGLYSSGADPEVLNSLIETYSAAQTAKGTYSYVKEAFSAVNTTLEGVIGSLNEMTLNLDNMASGLTASLEQDDMANSFAQLQEGLTTLSSNYKLFHSGLVDYTSGVSQLPGFYHELHNGIVELSGGTDKLDNGVGELHDGTAELYESTSDLPGQMKEKVDEMIADYDKSDFDAESFVSSENEHVESVQFVLKTESIEYEKQETKKEPVLKEEEKGFWTRLKDLFFIMWN
ncbi:hypothetical protein [Bacillus tuaregi]|uniref:hypothetical protein n=1 Tax=Bacillus tuaregi TaxID=1816695 RepID=UPI0008F8DE5D|nr:hypothetical protein [Bacillus tuaregi]